MGETDAAAHSHVRPKAYQTILLSGLLAGALDLTGACVTNGWRGLSPLRVFQSVASGVLGAESFKGGAGAGALGVALHFLIALGATAVYYAASRKLEFLVQHPLACGVLYGVIVYFVMSDIVVPLSAAPFKISHAPAALATGLVVHILCVGLPIALVVSRFSRRG